jgi:hypothetical protein
MVISNIRRRLITQNNIDNFEGVKLYFNTNVSDGWYIEHGDPDRVGEYF